MLSGQGNVWNHKRIQRIDCLLKLNFHHKCKQRLPVRNAASLATPEALNQSWSIDFMHDALTCGRRFWTFNVEDDFNREALTQWAEDHGVMLEFTKLGKPTQNAFIKQFNRTYRTEILDFYLFRILNEALEITDR